MKTTVNFAKILNTGIAFVVIFLFTVIFSACKKDTGWVCYECKDQNGMYLQTSCGEGEQGAFENSGNIAGVHDINVFRQQCKKK